LAEEGRFVPGTLLGGRYRIIALLGRGGMGEVYRATDLTLGQSVALKFLPEGAGRDQRLLERFHGEVRVARQVSHPNVCRVYDIGEVEGVPFLSMEYVDGEDLASLLQRFGRLPADKALETARKICAGLAAAHDRGIIHRDLKPANIMMNRRGEVVIMDFGLAALADQLSGQEARNGTPAYMAPEQLKGAEVTARSDIYALGLVLYELFTGRRPYDGNTLKKLLEQQEAAQLTSMTSIAADIDPGVEKAIRRCLDPDPVKRPPTAMAVAAALPGGDPLAAALAAGETPSPEMVAAAGETEGLARKYSVPCLAAVALCLFAVPVLRQQTDALLHAPLDYPPQVLQQKARDIAASFGYSKKPVDSAFWLDYRDDLLSYLKELPEPRKWAEWLAAEAPIRASYRESQAPLHAPPFGQVKPDNPPPTEPGMAGVVLDGNGRLRGFSAVPYIGSNALPEPVPPEAVFRAAGLDRNAFTESTPTSVPASPADQLSAWKGPHPAIPQTELTVEMGSWKGRVTFAKVISPWDKPASAAPEQSPLLGRFLLSVLAVGFLFALLLARRNWKLGRADRKGAVRLAAARFLLALAAWIGTVHAVPDGDTVFLFFQSIGDWLLSAAWLWILYLALEPELRARWPHSIVTWNRLLAGRWRDAQVGAHVLIGAVVGMLIWVSADLIEIWFGKPNVLGPEGGIGITLGSRAWFAAHTGMLGTILPLGLILFLSVFGLRLLVRKDLLAALLAAALAVPFNLSANHFTDWQILLPVYFVLFAVLTFVLLRLGLVAALAAVFFLNSCGRIIVGADWATWYAPYGVATLALLLGIALFAFWLSLGSRELLGSGVEG
jgi:serine/threonine-protein kinase